MVAIDGGGNDDGGDETNSDNDVPQSGRPRSIDPDKLSNIDGLCLMTRNEKVCAAVSKTLRRFTKGSVRAIPLMDCFCKRPSQKADGGGG